MQEYTPEYYSKEANSFIQKAEKELNRIFPK